MSSIGSALEDEGRDGVSEPVEQRGAGDHHTPQQDVGDGQRVLTHLATASAGDDPDPHKQQHDRNDVLPPPRDYRGGVKGGPETREKGHEGGREGGQGKFPSKKTTRRSRRAESVTVDEARRE